MRLSASPLRGGQQQHRQTIHPALHGPGRTAVNGDMELAEKPEDEFGGDHGQIEISFRFYRFAVHIQAALRLSM